MSTLSTQEGTTGRDATELAVRRFGQEGATRHPTTALAAAEGIQLHYDERYYIRRGWLLTNVSMA